MPAAADWVTLFGLPTVSSGADNQVSGAMSADGPASNLDDPEPAYPAVWIRPARGVRDTYANHDIDTGTKVNMAVVVGHNLQRGIGEIEHELWDSTPELPSGYDLVAPISTQGTVTNLTGAATDLDEDPDDAPDANWMTAVVNANDTDVRLRLGDPGGSFQSGDREQEVRILVRRTNTGGAGANPTLTVALWQNGVFLATLLTNDAIDSITGEVVAVYFNSSLLTGTANVEIRLSGTAANGRTVEMGAVQLRCYMTSANRIYRSGWETVDADASHAAWGDTLPMASAEEPRKTETHFTTSVVSGAIIALTKFRDPTNPDGYLSVGHVTYTWGWQPTEANAEAGARVMPIDQSRTERTQGGVLASQPVALRREATFVLPALTTDEAEQISLRAGWRVGITRPYGVCLNPATGYGRRFQTVWGRNAQGSVPAPEVQGGRGNRFRCAFRIEEC